jgi:hypothetical protein
VTIGKGFLKVVVLERGLAIFTGHVCGHVVVIGQTRMEGV